MAVVATRTDRENMVLLFVQTSFVAHREIKMYRYSCRLNLSFQLALFQRGLNDMHINRGSRFRAGAFENI